MSHRSPSGTVIAGIHTLSEDRFSQPILDDGCLLWFGDRWVAITDLQIPVVRLLLRNLDAPVTRELITATYGAAGGSTRDDAVVSLMRRTGARFTEIGATVRYAYRNRAMVVSFPPAPIG
jgi:hypothetical protein